MEKIKIKVLNSQFKINFIFFVSAIFIVLFTIFWQLEVISELYLQILIGGCFGSLIIYDFLTSYSKKRLTQKKAIIWLKFIFSIGFSILIAFTYHYILGFFVYLIGG